MAAGRDTMAIGRETMAAGREAMTAGREAMTAGRRAMAVGREVARIRIAVDMTSIGERLSGLERYAYEMLREMLMCSYGAGDVEYVLVVRDELPTAMRGWSRLPHVHVARLRLRSLPGTTLRKLFDRELRLPLTMAGIPADAYLFPAFPVPLLFSGRRALGCMRPGREWSVRRAPGCGGGNSRRWSRRNRRIYAMIADTACYDVPETMRPLAVLYWRAALRHTARVSAGILTNSRYSKERIRERLAPPGGGSRILVAYGGLRDGETPGTAVIREGGRDMRHPAAGAVGSHRPGSDGVRRRGGQGLMRRRTAEGEQDVGPGDTDVLGRYGITGPYYLTVGTREPRKALPLLLRAYACASGRRQERRGEALPQLVVVGRQGWMDESASKWRGSDAVVFTGFVRDSDLRLLYQGALAYVAPSAYEGLDLPPLEALQAGVRRVLASDIPAHREALGSVAHYFSSGNEAALASALEHLASATPAGEDEVRRQLRGYSYRRAAVRALAWIRRGCSQCIPDGVRVGQV